MKSMTGFASLSRDADDATIGVTVRTLNHRYLDLQLRLPNSLGDLEAPIRAMVQKRMTRGRVEIAVSLQLRQATTADVSLNEAFATALGSAVEAARARGLVNGPLTPGDLLRFPQAVVINDGAGASEKDVATRVGERVSSLIDEGLVQVDHMRDVEGTHLRSDLDARRAELARLVEQIAGAAAEGRAAVEARLTDRVREVAADVSLDSTAVAQEIVRTVARSDISEEIARFRGHLAHWASIVELPDACGRKLDFLLQEMHREVNTMGSKADGLSVSELIITTKAELEKMREQVQNVE